VPRYFFFIPALMDALALSAMSPALLPEERHVELQIRDHLRQAGLGVPKWRRANALFARLGQHAGRCEHLSAQPSIARLSWTALRW